MQQCELVLGGDASNRKALYRRGQALHALGRSREAVVDLERALQLSPEGEKALISAKLEEARQAAAQQPAAAAPAVEHRGGVVIEEVTEEVAAAGARAGAVRAGEVDGVVEEADEDEPPPLEAFSAPQAPAGMPGGFPAATPDQLRMAQEMLQVRTEGGRCRPAKRAPPRR